MCAAVGFAVEFCDSGDSCIAKFDGVTSARHADGGPLGGVTASGDRRCNETLPTTTSSAPMALGTGRAAFGEGATTGAASGMTRLRLAAEAWNAALW